MKLLRNILLLLSLSMFSPNIVLAQQFNFSQYSFTDQRVNPALVGIGNYWKFSGIHREQSTGPNFDIISTAFSGSYPLVKANDAGVLGGIGISLLDDRAGAGKAFKVQEIGLSYAMQVRTGHNQQLALGASAFRQTRGFDYDDLITNWQFIPGRGFDTSLDNGENFDRLRRSFYRVGAGLHWENRNANNLRSGHFGVAAFDLNQPREAFVDTTSTLDPTYILNAGFNLFTSGNLSFYPEVLLTRVGDSNTFNAGANVRYSLQNEGYLILQGQYLTGGEILAGIQFGKKDFRIGFSYDIPISSANSGNQGAFEFGFEFRGLVKSKSKPHKRKRSTPVPPKPTKTEPPIEEVKQDTVDRNPVVVEEEPIEPEIKTETGSRELENEPIIVERVTRRFGFEFNKATLSLSMTDYLDKLSKQLKDEPYLKVDVIGHTDSVGDEQVNQRLSSARAEAVRQYLIEKGISADRIKAEGRGELEPVSPNTTEKGRALNRRVELVIHR